MIQNTATRGIPPPSRARPAGALTAGLAATALLAAACSGGNSGGGPGGSAASTVSDTYQHDIAYSQCMRSHGDPSFPDPVQGPGGAWLFPATPQDQQAFSGPAFSAAQKACRKLQPSQGITPAERRAALSQLLRLARCMRAHGITNFPDPTSNSNSIGFHLGPGIDPQSPQFRAAQQACHMPGP